MLALLLFVAPCAVAMAPRHVPASPPAPPAPPAGAEPDWEAMFRGGAGAAPSDGSSSSNVAYSPRRRIDFITIAPGLEAVSGSGACVERLRALGFRVEFRAAPADDGAARCHVGPSFSNDILGVIKTGAATVFFRTDDEEEEEDVDLGERVALPAFGAVMKVGSMGSKNFVRDGLVEDLAEGAVRSFDELSNLVEMWRALDGDLYLDAYENLDAYEDAAAPAAPARSPDAQLRRGMTAPQLRAFFAGTPGLEAAAGAWDPEFDGELLFAEAEGRGIGLQEVLKEMGLALAARSRITLMLRECGAIQQV
ncbi:hypothetical protein M885DRAFT_521505, partial [Pelagophyceae sp. CCMP2097]